MAEIRKEVPSGAIDGSNLTFVLANEPAFIDDVFMDGAIYTTFSIVGKVLTLQDAPTSSLFADYQTGNDYPATIGNVTFGQAKAEVWTLLGQKPTSTVFSDARVGFRINAMVRAVRRGRVTSILDPNRIYRAGNLAFAEGKTSYRYVSPTRTTKNYAVGDTVLYCSTDGLLNSGRVIVGGEALSYSGKDSEKLLGVSGAEMNHLETETVTQLVPAPADMERPISVDAVIGENAYPIPFEGTHGKWYDLWHLNDGDWLAFYGLESETSLSMKYSKKTYDMSLDTDMVPVPDDYGLTVIAPLVAGEMAYETGLPIAQQLLVRAYDRLQNFYQFHTNATTVIKQSIKPQSYGFRSVNR